MVIVLSLISFALIAWVLRYHLLIFAISKGARKFEGPARPYSKGPRFVILVPAHNEELGIGATVGSLQALDYPRDAYSIVVIADNCSDQTATIARATGATVIERFDSEKKSKGYALEHAIQKIQLSRDLLPDAIVIVDADTRVDRLMLQAFASRLLQGQNWLQGYYSVANPNDHWRSQLMTYSFSLFNCVWLAGQDRLGMGSALRGNGMAFSWRSLVNFPWRAYGLAEDLEFSWHLRLAGEKVFFVPEAKVFGEIVYSQSVAVANQRLRWEHGRRELKKIFGAKLASHELPLTKRFLLSSDLKMPALSRLFFVSFLSCLVSAIAWVFAMRQGAGKGEWLFLGFLLTLQILLLVNVLLYLILPFVKFQLPPKYARTVLRAPFYMLWKGTLLLKSMPKQWVRTERSSKSEKIN